MYWRTKEEAKGIYGRSKVLKRIEKKDKGKYDKSKREKVLKKNRVRKIKDIMVD